MAIEGKAQKLTVRNYNAGFRVFEMNSVGNNPTTISALLKDPVSYQTNFEKINYNTLRGNPAPFGLKTIYLNAEWFKDSPTSRFWKKHSIQAGLLVTMKYSASAGSVADEYFNYTNEFTLTKHQQFFGGNIGFNKRINLSGKLQFITGFRIQGSFALVHHYHQQWDSSTYSTPNCRQTRTTILPELKGRKFFSMAGHDTNCFRNGCL